MIQVLLDHLQTSDTGCTRSGASQGQMDPSQAQFCFSTDWRLQQNGIILYLQLFPAELGEESEGKQVRPGVSRMEDQSKRRNPPSFQLQHVPSVSQGQMDSSHHSDSQQC